MHHSNAARIERGRGSNVVGGVASNHSVRLRTIVHSRSCICQLSTPLPLAVIVWCCRNLRVYPSRRPRLEARCPIAPLLSLPSGPSSSSFSALSAFLSPAIPSLRCAKTLHLRVPLPPFSMPSSLTAAISLEWIFFPVPTDSREREPEGLKRNIRF